ncbi:facilitated trehalose transporter Tret1-like isoform X1 [Teleopsis dalmanni]|uniref:facilitated trehalose transporter Tret1-like isoform X1 n=1 Tax=Teleopsis dalmanni TaxID=139649 RepID=UPI0018CECB04|nr:facilitated trehalose transporter Tret1-like isoform X1 [Teleopsis dalmanni]
MNSRTNNEPNEFQPLRSNRQPQIVSGLNGSFDRKPLGEQNCAVRRQEIMVILGNVGILSGGMALGLPTVTLRQLTDPNESIHLTLSQSSWFASLNMLSCPIGGLLCALILDRLGRKRTLYLLNMFAIIAWLLMALSTHFNTETAYLMLMISRLVIGITNGMSGAPVGVYAAEISMPKIRGRLILGTSIAVASGITLIYLLGFFIRDDWQLIALICSGYQIISLLCVIPMPETPSWLISKGRIAEAKASMNYFRGLEKSALITNTEVEAEFNILQNSIQLGVGEKKPSFFRSLKLPEVYKPLLILITLFAFQQTTGIFVVIVYAVQISTEAGVTIDPFLCAVLIGITRVLTTCPMGIILEKWGRRRSGIISALGMCYCMFLLAAQSWSEWLSKVPFLPVIAIVGFILLSTLGLYTLPFFMISELFPQKVRGPASGITVAVGMFLAFLCIKIYPSMKDVIGNEYCFVVYGVMAFLATIFIYLFLPETRGRTLLQIEDEFRHRLLRNSRSSALVEMREVFIK